MKLSESKLGGCREVVLVCMKNLVRLECRMMGSTDGFSARICVFDLVSAKGSYMDPDGLTSGINNLKLMTGERLEYRAHDRPVEIPAALSQLIVRDHELFAPLGHAARVPLIEICLHPRIV